MVEDENTRQILKALLEWGKVHAAHFWFVIFAFWGGTAGYLSANLRDNQAFSWKRFPLKLCISGFSGLCVAYILESAGGSFALVAVGAGMGGYMGDKMLSLIEAYIITKSNSVK